jgi:hypothetical protein
LARARIEASSIPVMVPPAAVRRADGDCDGFVVVEQQRGQRRARAEPVPAGGAGHGVHRVAEAAQPVHVPAQRPGAHPEPGGQLGARPVAASLQQRQHAQKAPRGFQHKI